MRDLPVACFARVRVRALIGPRPALLQDPAASAVMNADDAIIITASPDFMARPWLEKYLKVRLCEEETPQVVATFLCGFLC